MIRILLAAILCLSASNLPAQQPNAPITVDIQISPQALTNDSLSLKLLPEERQLQDGNAAPVLLRMVFEQQNYLKLVASKYDKWLDQPFDDPEMRRELSFGSFFKQLRRAAFIRDADWNYPIGEEPQVSILLPDVQTGRLFVGRGVSLYIRKQIADGNLEIAHEGVFVGLACARHYSQTPFLVCQLVSASMANDILNQCDLLIQQPDADNLFWAYQQLPKPLFDLTKSISLEKGIFENTIPELAKRPWPSHQEPQKWATIGGQLVGLFMPFMRDSSIVEQATTMQQIITYLKANWAEIGDETRDDAEQMSAEELAVRFYIKTANDLTQRFQVAESLDPPQALQMMAKSREQIQELATEIGNPKIAKLFSDPISSYVAAWRPTRKVIALQTVEAIRHYAATHDGKLPESLEDITDIPLPHDPFTGKPLEYKLGENSAALIMVNPKSIRSHERIGRMEFKYRIRLGD